MKFMVMHKADAKTEAGVFPSQELIANVGKLMKDAITRGILVDGAGLRPSSTRVRLTFSGTERTVLQGPYRGSNELIAGFAMLKVKSMEEAIDWASQFAKVMGDVEVEVGPVTEAWDLGMMPKPEGEVPLRVLAMHKADKASEAGAMPSAKHIAEMGQLIDKMVKAGVFISAQGLAPSARGARLRVSEGKRSVMDGPFAESKELISGFTIIELASLAEAVTWATQYADVVGASEVDVREVH